MAVILDSNLILFVRFKNFSIQGLLLMEQTRGHPGATLSSAAVHSGNFWCHFVYCLRKLILPIAPHIVKPIHCSKKVHLLLQCVTQPRIGDVRRPAASAMSPGIAGWEFSVHTLQG